MTSDLSKIVMYKTEWMTLDRVPTGRGPMVQDMIKRYGVTGAGVYQIAYKSNNPTEEFVQKDIGYTGMSSNVFSRVAGIKTGKHGAGKLIRELGYKHEDILVRYLFTKPDDERLLETSIHSETRHQFGYTFKWTEASGGNSGISTRILTDLYKVENPYELTEILRRAKERLSTILVEAAMEGSLGSLASDYFADETA